MKCSRCEQPVVTTSAVATDHKYIQSCIDALKARIREVEKELSVMISGPGMPEARTTFGAVNSTGVTARTSGYWGPEYFQPRGGSTIPSDTQ